MLSTVSTAMAAKASGVCDCAVDIKVEHGLRHRLEPGDRVDENRKEADQHDDDNLRPIGQPEPQDDQRRHRDRAAHYITFDGEC
jgi:hypothetical protein